MDKLLVLGAGTFQLPLIQAAKNKGVQVIAITPEGDYPGIEAADKVYFHDARDCEYALEIGRKEQINGVISDQSEIFVIPVAYVAENLGLPGNAIGTAHLYKDKSLMRKRSRELGLPTIESYVVDSLDEAREVLAGLGLPSIIKPVDSFSSRGISMIRTEKDLEEAWDEAKQFSSNGNVIVEKFIDGDQFEVDSIALNGVVKPLMYADLKEFNIPNVFSSSSRLYPSVADETTVKKLLDVNQRISEGFGMKLGVSHNEYVQDSKTGDIYLIECALRGGGTYIGSHISKLETGLNVADFLVDAALGYIDEIPAFEMNQCHAGYACFYLPEGEVLSISGLDEVEKLPYVAKTKFNDIKTGETIISPRDKDQRCAIILYADSRDELLDRIEECKGLIDIKIQTENGVQGPIWQ